ncbi:hypothetical protein D3C76_1649320 [compost metagenome]|jgi:hypothetical protein
MCLFDGLLWLEGFVDLDELLLALAQQFFLRVFTPYFDELEVIAQTFSHFSKPLNSSCKLLAASRKSIT